MYAFSKFLLIFQKNALSFTNAVQGMAQAAGLQNILILLHSMCPLLRLISFWKVLNYVYYFKSVFLVSKITYISSNLIFFLQNVCQDLGLGI